MKKKLVECCKGAAMCGPEAVAMTKKLIADCANQPISQELLSHVGEQSAKLQTGKEAKEAATAISEKRAPQWVSTGIKP
jgi:methylglutaconyl-CoA hydratase